MLRFLIPAVTAAVLVVSASAAYAQFGGNPTPGGEPPGKTQAHAKAPGQVKKKTRTIDAYIATCNMLGSEGLAPRPALTHMRQSDYARIHAEDRMKRRAKLHRSDETYYYQQMTGDEDGAPFLNRYRVSDRLGLKKGCTPPRT